MFLVTSRAALMVSLVTTSAPLPLASSAAATAHRLQEILRTVGAERAELPLRRGQDDGLVGLHREMQEVGRLLDGVRAMRDDDAFHLAIARDDLIDAPRERQPLLHRDGARADAHHFFHVEPRDFL